MDYPIYETGYYKLLYKVRKLATPLSIGVLVLHFVMPLFFPHEDEIVTNAVGALFAVLLAWILIYAGYLVYVRKFNNLDVKFTGAPPDLSQVGHFKLAIISGFLASIGLLMLLGILMLVLIFNIGTLFGPPSV